MKSNARELSGLFPLPVTPVGERPLCPGCGQPRRVVLNRDLSTWRPGPGSPSRNSAAYPVVSWRYLGYGHFCTQTCATRFANRAVDERGWAAPPRREKKLGKIL